MCFGEPGCKNLKMNYRLPQINNFHRDPCLLSNGEGLFLSTFRKVLFGVPPTHLLWLIVVWYIRQAERNGRQNCAVIDIPPLSLILSLGAHGPLTLLRHSPSPAVRVYFLLLPQNFSHFLFLPPSRSLEYISGLSSPPLIRSVWFHHFRWWAAVPFLQSFYSTLLCRDRCKVSPFLSFFKSSSFIPELRSVHARSGSSVWFERPADQARHLH